MGHLISFLFLLACGSAVFAQTRPADADAKLWQRALAIHRKAIIVDGHNDITSPMVDEDFDLTSNSRGQWHKDGDPFHTDFSRLKESGITGEFFSIYVSASFADPKTYGERGGSAKRAMELIDATYRAVERYPDKLSLCTTARDIQQAKKQGKICALMGIEGGHAIEDSLYALRVFHRLGVRYMTLTHNNTNNWADACCSPAKHAGLSDFGKEVIKEMNRLGMLVDLSHVSDETMNDVFDVATAPVIYSHSCARKFSDHRRNVPDDILKRLAKNGGVLMINFYPAFLDQRYRDESRARDEKLKPQVDALREQHKNDPAGFRAAERKLLADNPIYVPGYTRIVDHIDHIRDVAGIDYIGIGSDYDGVPLLPQGMNGAEDLALVTYEMLRRGYSEKDVLKVLGGNFLRAFAQAEQVARRAGRNISGDGSLKKITRS
jgi:membrane dipeptidase